MFHLDIARARPVFYDAVLFELSRKWALFQGSEMCSILTTTGLSFGWGKCIGIAGVATRIQHQGRGYAQRLLEAVLEHASLENEGPAMLFAHEQSLYKRVGFTLTDEVIRGNILTAGAPESNVNYPIGVVQSHYARWAAETPDRLVRTSDRWRYWGLSCRICEPLSQGYYIPEPGLIREAVLFQPMKPWCVPLGSQWYGLRSVTTACEVPVKRVKPELLFMTRGVPGQPQMFMTDQF